jgi:hypothetical protein
LETKTGLEVGLAARKRQAAIKIYDFVQHGLGNPFVKGKQSSLQNQHETKITSANSWEQKIKKYDNSTHGKFD